MKKECSSKKSKSISRRTFINYSSAGVAGMNVIVSAVKQSEKDEDIILRCVETCGQPVFATLSVPFEGRQWSGDFRPYEIKTLKYFRKSGDIKVVNVLEE